MLRIGYRNNNRVLEVEPRVDEVRAHGVGFTCDAENQSIFCLFSSTTSICSGSARAGARRRHGSFVVFYPEVRRNRKADENDESSGKFCTIGNANETNMWMKGNKKNQDGYESIPDAESPDDDLEDESPKGLLDEKQTELLNNINHVIDNAQSLSFEIPNVSPEEMASRSAAYIQSLVEPTITAMMAACTALLLGYLAQAQAFSDTVQAAISMLFPYANAMIISYSSFNPIHNRCMKSMEPVYDTTEKVQKSMVDGVDGIGKQVNATIDNIQEQIHQVLQPLRPKLEIATKQEAMLKKIRPDIDIPDYSDIDREFDGMQGQGDAQLEIAKNRLTDIQTLIPSPLRSPKAFYWRIIFPILAVFLSLQLGMTFVTIHKQQQTSGTRNLSSILSKPGQLRGFHAWIPQEGIAMIPSNVDTEDSENWSGKAQQNVQEYKDEVDDQVHSIVDDWNVTKMQDTAQEYVSQAKEEMMNQWNSTVGEFHNRVSGYQQEASKYRDSMFAKAKPMLQNVLLSYLMAALQLGIVYVLSNPAIKSWFVNKAIAMATNQVQERLRETGVMRAKEEVLGTRMKSVKRKINKIIQFTNQVEELLGKFGGIEEKLGDVGTAIGFGRFNL